MTGASSGGYAVTETYIILDLTVFVVAVWWIGIWFVWVSGLV